MTVQEQPGPLDSMVENCMNLTTTNNSQLRWGLSLAVAVCSLIGLARIAEAQTATPAKKNTANVNAARQESIRRIAAMPEEQRRRIKRNLEIYRGLSVEERKRLHELSAALEADKRSTGVLNKTRDRYFRFLASAEPAVRDEIARATDVSNRVKAVRRASKQMPQSGPLPATQVAAVMKYIEDRVSTNFNANDLSAMRAQPAGSAARFVLVLDLATRIRGQQPPVLFEKPMVLQAEIRKATQPSTRPARFPLRDFMKALLESVQAQVRNNQSVTDEELDEFFTAKLTAQQRDELMELPAIEQMPRVRQLFLASKKEATEIEKLAFSEIPNRLRNHFQQIQTRGRKNGLPGLIQGVGNGLRRNSDNKPADNKPADGKPADGKSADSGKTGEN